MRIPTLLLLGESGSSFLCLFLPNCKDEITQYALKGQKLLAQGTALGLLAVNKAPCKGKSFVYCLVLEGFCPYRAAGLHP